MSPDSAWTLLTAAQAAATRRVLAEERARRRHLVVSLSGAHAYGFPSPDSDVDAKAIHLDDPRTLLGFPRPPSTAERLELVDGVEVDYSSNELGPVLLAVLKGNGNYLERLLGPCTLEGAALLEPLRPLIARSLSRRVARHYQGFATQQRAEWERGERASAKKLLYVLRTALTGTHLLLEGEVITDVTALLTRYGFGEATALVEEKRRGEKSTLPAALSAHWDARLPELFATLARAEEHSVLPPEPPNADELEAWLIEVRSPKG